MTETTDERPVTLDDGDDLAELLAREEVALVDFWTKGCSLCDAMEPVVGNVARVADVQVATLNPGNDIDLVDEHDIRSVPTLILFVDGEEVDRIADGFVGVEGVLSMIREHVPERVPEEAVPDADGQAEAEA
ncbi:MAG: thioredoxin family protein [Halopenitus sp.]